MKKLLTIFALITSSILSYAQYTLTPKGLAADSGKAFDVYTYEGLSQADLYTSVYRNITRIFISPKDVISAHEPDVISINAILQIERDNPVSKVAFMNVTISVEFKDGKVRVNMPDINRIYAEVGYQDVEFLYTETFVKPGIFHPNGKVKMKNMKSSIENKLNWVVSSMLAGIGSAGDEW